MRPVSTTLLLAAASITLASCRGTGEDGFLSSAVLESDLWKVSPQTAGTYVSVSVREGDSVAAGAEVASIDTVPLALKRAELDASLAQLRAEVAAREAENRVQVASDRGTARELERARNLQAGGAATGQRLDDLTVQKETSSARLAANRAAVAALRSRALLLEAQRATLADQIARCRMLAPGAGVVLERFREAGEAAVPGRPAVEIGRVDSLRAEFFVAQPDLARMRLGQALRLRVDSAGGEIWVPARLVWISDEAEFTPKGVQTREGRNELVFRARAMAANPAGLLKRGLPVEVWE